jgi:hypothetical protein
METTYIFPQVNGGYRWNMFQRIYYAIGLRQTASWDANGKTYLVFERALTESEETLLNDIMNNDPTNPPATTNTEFKVKDLYEFQTDLMNSMGLSFKMFFSESISGSGRIDMINLQFDKVLTSQEKNKVINMYQSLIDLK